MILFSLPSFTCTFFHFEGTYVFNVSGILYIVGSRVFIIFTVIFLPFLPVLIIEFILSRIYLVTSPKVAIQRLFSLDFMYLKYSSSRFMSRASHPIPSTPWSTSTSHILSFTCLLYTSPSP